MLFTCCKLHVQHIAVFEKQATMSLIECSLILTFMFVYSELQHHGCVGRNRECSVGPHLVAGCHKLLLSTGVHSCQQLPGDDRSKW